MSARSDDKVGPSQASMNAPLPPEPRRKGRASGSAGRDAGEGAGIDSGLCYKQSFEETGESQLGKPLEASGNPPWDSKVPEETVGTAPTDTFGAGERFTIKNG